MDVEENNGTGEVQEPVIVSSQEADTAKQHQDKVEEDQGKEEGEQKEKETKKRKAYASRSDVWESYIKIKIGDELKRAKCKFCSRELLCDTKRNGGRVLDDFRSSLTPSMVERLICTQDWLAGSPPICIEEDPEKLAQIEEDVLAQKDGCTSKSKASVSKANPPNP